VRRRVNSRESVSLRNLAYQVIDADDRPVGSKDGGMAVIRMLDNPDNLQVHLSGALTSTF
jgi:hypothetical protein